MPVFLIRPQGRIDAGVRGGVYLPPAGVPGSMENGRIATSILRQDSKYKIYTIDSSLNTRNAVSTLYYFTYKISLGSM